MVWFCFFESGNNKPIRGNYSETIDFGSIKSGGAILEFSIVDNSDSSCTIAIRIDRRNISLYKKDLFSVIPSRWDNAIFIDAESDGT